MAGRAVARVAATATERRLLGRLSLTPWLQRQSRCCSLFTDATIAPSRVGQAGEAAAANAAQGGEPACQPATPHALMSTWREQSQALHVTFLLYQLPCQRNSHCVVVGPYLPVCAGTPLAQEHDLSTAAATDTASRPPSLFGGGGGGGGGGDVLPRLPPADPHADGAASFSPLMHTELSIDTPEDAKVCL
jgi:hypothetical protein